MEPEKNLEAGLDADPLAEQRGKGGFPPRKQAWPGLDRLMHPRPDHGERTYRGSGKLQGRTALITGGDSGIGRAVAIAFARERADVAIAYYDEHEDAEETVRWIRDAGRLGILVNNAAVHGEKAGIEEISPERLEGTFRTNVYAAFWLAQAVPPQMKAGDVIINTGSVTGLRGSPKLLDCAATKAALHDFTVSLAKEVAPRGIRVNRVSPGPVRTPLIVSTREESRIPEFGTDTVWGRAAQPAEIAPTYVFLASGDSRSCTGEIFAPTGADTTR